MDEDFDELIAHLCTRLGTIMEDASAIAIDVTGLRDHERRAAVVEISMAAAKIAALSKAIDALSG